MGQRAVLQGAVLAICIFLACFLVYVLPRSSRVPSATVPFKHSMLKLYRGHNKTGAAWILDTTGGIENVIRNETQQRLPQCLIIGVRKGGTRALLEYIALHPRVKIAINEGHFFDKSYKKGLEWYRKQMPFSEPGDVTVEKTPKYLVLPEVPERVFRMNKSIKLIVTFRDPTERTISDYVQTHRSDILAGRNVTIKFEKYAINHATGKININWHAIQTSLYHLHVRRWFKRFPREQFLFLDSKKLVEDPVSVLRRIEKFLNLEHRISRNLFYFNVTKGFYCRKGPSFSEGGCLGKTKGLPHPEVNPKVIKKLRAFFRPHNQLLYRMLGHNYGWP